MEILRDPNAVRSGGGEWILCSVPVAFEGRYFIVKPGNPLLLSVVKCIGRQLVFEVKDNGPVINMLTDFDKKPDGTVAVSEKVSGRLLYKVRPGQAMAVAFGRPDGGETGALISEKEIRIGGIRVENRAFRGGGSVVTVGSDGSVGPGSPIPPSLLQWFRK